VADLRPDRWTVGADAGTAAVLRGRLAGAGGGRGAAAGRRPLEGDLSRTDAVWSEQDTSASAIEAALRKLLFEQHAANPAWVPARVLNLVVIVDARWSGEIANRLARVGRYHPSRTVVCAVEPGRTTIDAHVKLVADVTDDQPEELALTFENVIVHCGEGHLPHLDSIVNPLVVPDLATVVWAPHGHAEGVDALLDLSQVVLLDSVDEPEVDEALDRACTLSREAYVVDLAWLRSTPWRERVAATFDPAKLRPDLRHISAVTVRHHPESGAAAMLFVGWLASRLDWEPARLHARDGASVGKAHARRQDVELRLESDAGQSVRGLASVELQTASGRWLRLDRGPGGLRAHYKHARGTEREWTVLGASRGEAGILGEGIRQALLRDPTYAPALASARAFAR
jgi:glucose-6-phosphate dehydrogenase assembly protein OpcA